MKPTNQKCLALSISLDLQGQILFRRSSSYKVIKISNLIDLVTFGLQMVKIKKAKFIIDYPELALLLGLIYFC